MSGRPVRARIVASAAALANKVPPIRGLGLLLEYATRVFSHWDVDVAVRIDGSLMWANPTIVSGRRRLFTSAYHDRNERAFVKRVIERGDYVIDVGANVGTYTLLCAKLGASVTAIEAEPANAAILRRNIALNGYVVDVRQVGASDKAETLSLNLDEGDIGSHSFVKVGTKRSVEIECLPLAKVVVPRQAKLMKIDIEGFEYRVLKRYFADTPISLRPQWILLEEWATPPEGSAVALCGEAGYSVVHRWDTNFALRLGDEAAGLN